MSISNSYLLAIQIYIIQYIATKKHKLSLTQQQSSHCHKIKIKGETQNIKYMK